MGFLFLCWLIVLVAAVTIKIEAIGWIFGMGYPMAQAYCHHR